MHDKLFESALGISTPWSVQSVEFDAAGKRLTVVIDFTPGTRFGMRDTPACTRCTTP